MSDFDALVRALRRWTANHDPHVRAAVELLIEHETWIRRADFQRACIKRDAREAWVNWRKAREFAPVPPAFNALSRCGPGSGAQRLHRSRRRSQIRREIFRLRA